MNYEEYRNTYFTDPLPEPRYRYDDGMSVTLYFEAFTSAVNYYQQVLGPPAYVEGEGTVGWQIGSGWLTLLRGQSGNPRNMEVTFQLNTPGEAERMQREFIQAGGTGPDPSDQIMYQPVRYCPVRDPFGTQILIISHLKLEG